MVESGAIRAGRAFVEIFADDSQMQRKLRSASATFKAWGASVTAVGRQVMTAGLVATAFFGLAARQFAETGAELQHMSERTGASVESLSVLKFVAGQTGTEFAALEGGIRKIQKNLVEAKLGNKEAAESFAMLGLSGRTLEKSGIMDILGVLADKVQSLKNPNEQAAIAMKVAGKAGTELLPMLKQGAEGIRNWTKEAEKFGLVMSTQDAKKATELHETLNLLWSTVQMGVVRIGSALAPELIELARWLAGAAKSAGDFIQANSGWIVSVSKMATGVVLAGGGLMVLGTGLKAVSPLLQFAGFGLKTFGRLIGGAFTFAGYAIKFLSMGVSTLGAIIWKAVSGVAVAAFQMLSGGISAAVTTILSLLTPIGIIGFALVGLAAYFLYASGTIGKAMDEGSKFFKQLLADGTEAFGGIAAALAKGDIAAAAKVVWALIKLEWEQGKAALNNIWQDGKRFFLDTWTSAVYSLSGLMINGFALIESAWVESIDFIADAFAALTRGMLVLMAPVAASVSSWAAYIGAKVQGASEEMANLAAAGAKAGVENAFQATTDEIDKTVSDREQKRNASLADIEQRKKDALDANKSANDSEIDAHRKAQDQAIDDAKARVADARKEFDDANKAAKAPAKKDGKGLPGVPPGIGELDKLVNSQSGTLSGFGVQGLGAGAKSLEQIAGNTAAAAKSSQDMYDLLDNMQPSQFWQD